MASVLHSRIESAINTAKRWESDKELLAEIRASIPFKELVPESVCETEYRCRSYLNNSSTEEEVKDDNNNDAAEKKVEEDNQYKTSCFKDDDTDWEGDDLLLKRLTLYFKQEVMSWCNQPPCCNPNCKGNEDGKQMEHKGRGMRGPETEEEKAGNASRVEVYNCKLCNTETTFPRFNSPRALFKSRRGRCGEFANLFGTYCRALGFDARYIHDFTDHVWVEVWSVRQQRWIHADSCEGLIDRPNMYEQGWGKKLNYAVGATHDSVVDVTKRYTRKFYSDEFQARRREFAPHESTSDRIFQQMGAALKQMSNIAKGRLEELEKREKAEEKYFGLVQSSGVWDVEYREGRISGSVAWKASRHELGDINRKKAEGGDEAKSDESDVAHSFFVESFYPSKAHDDLTVSPSVRREPLTIVIQPPAPSNVPLSSFTSHPECITVAGVPCATTLTNGISVVVVDETNGCILQSKAFSHWVAAGKFLDTIPSGRIVALCSMQEDEKDDITKNSTIDDSTSTNFNRLGGFNIKEAAASSEGCNIFVGQLDFHPQWASYSTQCIKVSLQLNYERLCSRLRTEINTVPAAISGRLPETVMPLKTQLTASDYQKRVAFLSFIEKLDYGETDAIGYTTRADAPVYLIDKQSFPFRSDGQTHNTSANDTGWTTYHYLPDALVPDDDVMKEDTPTSSKRSATPKFDVPIADDYFIGLLGNQLFVKNATSTPTLMDTSSALANTRLVGLYFSASWCGPCRGFTPLLIEFYNHLKEEVAATHGLEIVFVSSDRDEGQFQQYYGKMPFLALPFPNRALAQHCKSVFGVRGIPSFVVIDTMSGRIVTSPDVSRREVHQACQRGEQAIESLFKNWLDKVPPETKSMLEILELSCNEADKSEDADKVTTNIKAERYLSRMREDVVDNSKSLPAKEATAARVKEIFTDLVSKGMQPNAAAVEAIKQATNEESSPLGIEEGALKGTVEECTIETSNKTIEEIANTMCQLNGGDKTKVVLSTAKKYVANVQKDPSNPRFRNFRLSNKIFDKITSTPGSIDLLKNLGFAVYHSDADFVASIPLATNLTLMGGVLDKLLETSSD